MKRRARDLAQRGIRVSPFRGAAVTQLPYVVPGASDVVAGLDTLRRSVRRPRSMAELEGLIPCADIEAHGPCPLCGADRVRVLFHPGRPPSATGAGWAYRVGQCTACTLLYRIPAIRPERVPDLYETGSYADFLDGDYGRGRKHRYNATLDAFAPLFSSGNHRRLLDFGCGTGTFMELASRRGFDPFGVDLAPEAVSIAQQRFGDDHAVHGSSAEVRHEMGGEFDVITMWSVLAHIPLPRVQLAELRDLLKPGGHLVILTVNATSLQLRAFRSSWNGFTPNHLMFWSATTLARLSEELGFSLAEFRPSYGVGIERGSSSLRQVQVARYRRAVERFAGGNMLRAVLTK